MLCTVLSALLTSSQHSLLLAGGRCIDEGGRESSGLGELFDAATSHLGEKDVSFFQKWFNLVDVEVQCSVRRNPLSDIWGMDPDERYGVM